MMGSMPFASFLPESTSRQLDRTVLYRIGKLPLRASRVIWCEFKALLESLNSYKFIGILFFRVMESCPQ